MAEKELVLKTISSILQVKPDDVNTDKKLTEVGMNSIQVAHFIITLKKNHYNVLLSDIIAKKLTIGDIISIMTKKDTKINQNSKGKNIPPDTSRFQQFSRTFAESDNFVIVLLSECPDREKGLEMNINAFTETHPWISSFLKNDEVIRMWTNAWPSILEKNISAAAIDKTTQKMVASCFNVNLATYQDDLGYTELKSVSDGFKLIQDLAHLNGKLKPATLERYGGDWLYQYTFTIDPDLNVSARLEVAKLLFRGIPVLAREKGFVGIAAINVNPLTVLMDDEDPNVECVDSIQVNQYTCEDGTQPFKHLPDIERVTATIYKF